MARTGFDWTKGATKASGETACGPYLGALWYVDDYSNVQYEQVDFGTEPPVTYDPPKAIVRTLELARAQRGLRIVPHRLVAAAFAQILCPGQSETAVSAGDTTEPGQIIEELASLVVVRSMSDVIPATNLQDILVLPDGKGLSRVRYQVDNGELIDCTFVCLPLRPDEQASAHIMDLARPVAAGDGWSLLVPIHENQQGAWLEDLVYVVH